MALHSPEPWRLEQHGKWLEIIDANDETVAADDCRVHKHDFQRIVDCVNYCAKMDCKSMEFNRDWSKT